MAKKALAKTTPVVEEETSTIKNNRNLTSPKKKAGKKVAPAVVEEVAEVVVEKKAPAKKKAPKGKKAPAPAPVVEEVPVVEEKAPAKKTTAYEDVKPSEVKEMLPKEKMIIRLDIEPKTNFFIIYKDKTHVVALDKDYTTISIPVSDFNKGKWTFEREDGEGTYTCKLAVYQVEKA